jgi:hypothetical protein
VSRRGLGRQHHGIGPVEDGVGDIGRLGTGRTGPFDHRLEHLGGGHHQDAGPIRFPQNLPLQHRHPLQRDLDTEVPTRDHHTVGDRQDLPEVLDREAQLQLGDDRDVAPPLLQETPHAHDIGRVADKRDSEIIGRVPDGEIEILPVLAGQRRASQHGLGEVHPLLLAQESAGHHPALHLPAPPALCPQLHAPVVEQDRIAGAHVPRQRRAGRRQEAGAADDRSRGQRHALSSP